MTLDIAFVGTGAAPEDQDREGFAMAYKHAAAYHRLDDCELVACADIVPENAARFAQEFGIDGIYEEFEAMLKSEDPDIVSVCVPPRAHAEVVVGCARHGDLEAIHCEKPMAHSWAACREMVKICDEEDVNLTFNHQRRLGRTYRKAKSLLDRGKIGNLRRIEIATDNLYDAGTHLFELCGYYTDQTPVEWVLAGLDYRDENRWFGAHNENQALAQWRYEDGVYGLASMGEGAVDCYLRLVGDNGTIEIGAVNGPPLRMRNGRTLGWSTINTGENIWGDTRLGYMRAGLSMVAPSVPGLPEDPFDAPSHIDLAIESVVEAVRTGESSELRAENALQATEVIFAAWESVRRRGRVDLPLEITDNPLEAMVEAGVLNVATDGDGDATGKDDQTEVNVEPSSNSTDD
jgi:predicted dehydrogenase